MYNDAQDYYGKRRVTKSRMLKEKGHIVHIDSLTSDEISWIEHFLELMCNDNYLTVIHEYFSANTTKVEVARKLNVDISVVIMILEQSYFVVRFCDDWLGLKFTSVEERILNGDYSIVSMVELVGSNSRGAHMYNSYMRVGIRTLRDFLSIDYNDLKSKRGISKTSVDGVIDKLRSYGYVYKGKVV